MNKVIAEMQTISQWQIPVAVKNALCEDGKRRYARITSHPDTFFSIPAQVKITVQSKRYTVSGFITGRETADYKKDYAFIAYSYGKNGHLLKGQV